ncbi:hypothetical protein SAMN05421858_0005 [Haladaptatus litoreus]|uniref:Uncharacterized protein n=1 Tax=Haladaptatus litoreus TaxID=553468 RepID=A0A1N6ULD0_9EURY|nr:hypothetical protein [Haladaptatus litoreus]SIQ66357.1 hypothetical protein SAMN05421858_0005 [Haladaptatus litoreus]
MQRRAAGVYVTVFLVIAAGAYSLIGVAQEPTVSVENPDQTLSNQGQKFNVDGRQYNVTSLSDGSAEVAWTNQSATYSAELGNNTTVEQDNTTFRLLIPNQSNPSQATLTEVQNLSEDTQTVNQGNVTYVVVNQSSNDTANKSLVPVDEYKQQQFGEPETQTLRQGNNFQYQNNSTTIANISAESVLLQWEAPKTTTTSLSSGETAELGPNNQTYVAHGQDGSVVLSSNVDAYNSQNAEIGEFNERIAGLWGVSILSFLAALLLAMFAFLPFKG